MLGKYICGQLMSDNKGIVSVASKHIETGIKKYSGEPDAQLNTLIHNAGFNYTSYIFNDGRILLVLPDNVAAFLYADQEALFKALDLGT
jgi:hypothetical protein